MSAFHQGFWCGVAALALTSIAVFALIVVRAAPEPAKSEKREDHASDKLLSER